MGMAIFFPSLLSFLWARILFQGSYHHHQTGPRLLPRTRLISFIFRASEFRVHISLSCLMLISFQQYLSIFFPTTPVPGTGLITKIVYCLLHDPITIYCF